jgi:hypothetical protein
MAETIDTQGVAMLGGGKSPAETIEVDEARAAAFMAAIKDSSEIAKTAANGAIESQKQAAQALADAQSKLVEINNAGTQTVAAMTKVVDDQAVIATKSDHIQNAQIHADQVRASLDRVLTTATQQATDAEGLKARAQTAADNVAQVLSAVRATKGTVDVDADAIAAALTVAEESVETTRGLAERSNTIEARIEAYETKLAALEDQCMDQLKTIEGLLPGATSAGLAHAFDQRRQTFLEPKRKWEKWFVGSVVAIVLIAAVSLLQILLGKATPTWDEIVLLWLSRMPVVGALVWLAIHASHEAALAKRMEEDYGYKSAIASTFLGFHQQMAAVGSAASSNGPLSKLCNDTLSTLASPPGRIYDKYKLTVSPSRELKEAAEAAGEMFKAGMKPTA